MTDARELQLMNFCKEIKLTYIEPDGDGRQKMLDEISAYRQKQYEQSEARRQAEEKEREEREAKEAEERNLNSGHLTFYSFP